MVQTCTSERGLEVLVGPAGSGKTSTLAAIKATWTMSRFTAGVIGLAPSAAAAQQLSSALAVHCETTAKWLYETVGPAGQRRIAAIADLDAQLKMARLLDGPCHDLATKRRALTHEQQKWLLHSGQLLIIDEASLAGTLDLDHLVTQARTAGAKVLLVGDQQQLSAVQAGGAFGLLARRTRTAELTGLWRFSHRWEAQATRLLRHGDPAALHSYAAHDRLHSGEREHMLDAAYRAWRSDWNAGLDSLLIAVDNATVTELNARARTDAVHAGLAEHDGVLLSDGTNAGIGDRIITRQNDRRLPVGKDDHVRNGNTWTVTAKHRDGALSVQLVHRNGRRDHSEHAAARIQGHQNVDAAPTAVLPAHYIAEHVDLGYAITAQRVQSRTVDSTHVITGQGMSREHLYVALSRGREANHAYTPLDEAERGLDPHRCLKSAAAPTTGRELLEQILATSSAEPSATESLEASHGLQFDPRRPPHPQKSAPPLHQDLYRVPDGPGLSL